MRLNGGGLCPLVGFVGRACCWTGPRAMMDSTARLLGHPCGFVSLETGRKGGGLGLDGWASEAEVWMVIPLSTLRCGLSLFSFSFYPFSFSTISSFLSPFPANF